MAAPTGGRVRFLGEDITSVSTAERRRLGLARTHQIPRPFTGVTVFGEAAESVGVRVAGAKRLVFVLAAFGAAMGGALRVVTALTFQPKAYFSPLWTASVIFMALVGGLGTFERAILGAVIFFAEAWFGAMGVGFLVGLGAMALVFALFFPRGLWGWVDDRTSLRLLPIGYRLRQDGADAGAASSTSASES